MEEAETQPADQALMLGSEDPFTGYTVRLYRFNPDDSYAPVS